VKTDNEILNELRQLSPVIAEIGRGNVFEVPLNYFEQFAGMMLLRVQGTQGDEPVFSSLQRVDKNLLFTAPPQGYFEGFADKMLSRIKAESIGSVNEEIATLSPLLSKIKKEMPYLVPQDYFESFSGAVIESSQAIEFVNSELESLSPMMADLRNKNPYNIPSDYFEQLPDSILSRVQTAARPAARVISIGSRKMWVKFAAAAIFIGFISTVSFFALNKKTVVSNMDPIASLSKVSDDEMVNYLQNQELAIPDSTLTNSPLATIDLSSGNDAIDLLSNITDDELQQYVNEDISFKEDDHVN
jgi:hypothetical protein